MNWNYLLGVTTTLLFSLNVSAANILGDAAPASGPDADTNAIEVGVKFKSSVDGRVTAIRFYRGVVNASGYTVNLWSAEGTNLSRKTVASGSTGWISVPLATPINIKAGTVYVASYFTNRGRYSAQANGFASAVVSGQLTALASSSNGGNGVYRYGSSTRFPRRTYQATNYYVDVEFTASSTPPAAPVVDLSANPSSIQAGGSSTLTLTSSNATSCTGSGFSTGGATSGSFSVSPASSTSYSVTCTGAGGSASDQVSVAVTSTPPPPPPPVSGVELPGPSASLFANNSYYTCVNNLYVSTSGNDANNGSQASPVRSIQRATDLLPGTAAARAGYCINVMNGNYSVGDISVSKGGNAASMTGFVVYRATSLLGAKLTATGFDIFKVQAPYVIIDGFEMIGRRTGNGVNSCFNNNGMSYNGIHHVITMNNYVHDMGESGIKNCWAEYFWVIHNRLDTNGYNTWESGHSTYQPIVIPGYTATAYDKKWTPYHNVYVFNRFNGNFTSPAGSPHTDGNGLIYDDTQHKQSAPTVTYAPMALIMGNLSWGNGGAGIQVGPGSANADVFNNTAYNNYLDTYNTGTWRGELSASITSNINFRNNVAYAVPASSGIRTSNSPYLGGNPTGTNSWINNIAFGASPNMTSPNVFSSSQNRVGANPLMVNPAGGNFALCTGVGTPVASCTGKSPAVGTGVAVPYWYQQTAGQIDVGACPAGIVSCP